MGVIDKALSEIDRADFVPMELIGEAYLDMTLPIGYDQTISQPSTVRMMLEWLDAQPRDKVLDVGSGSGWTIALLSSIVGPEGFVFAVEVIPEILKFGKANCSRLNIHNVKFSLAKNDVYGLPSQAPYDRILVSASATELPIELVDQVRVGGKLVIPVQNDIFEIYKTSDKKWITIIHPGFVFVPLV